MRRVRTASSLVVEQLVGVLEADQDYYEIKEENKALRLEASRIKAPSGPFPPGAQQMPALAA